MPMSRALSSCVTEGGSRGGEGVYAKAECLWYKKKRFISDGWSC